jgi:curved DNA-binding protein CbpA
MATLYEILGLSKNATPEQVNQGFLVQSEKIKANEPDLEAARMRQLAVREAFDILSSPSRRQAYDNKLNQASGQVSYDVDESPAIPWVKIAIGVVVLAVVVFLYQKRVEANVKREAIAQQALIAKAEAERAAQEAEAEQARLAQGILADREKAESKRMRELEQARRDGDRIHQNLEQAAERDRYRERQELENERRERERAQYDKVREEQLAKARIEQQNAALRRALAIRVRTPD